MCLYILCLLYRAAVYFVCNHGGELYKLLDGELFGPLGHDVLSEKVRRGHGLRCEELAQRDAQHLAALAENRLHHTFEEHFVATEIIYVVACHAYHGTLDLWWRVEDALVDGEEILHVVPRLYHHAEDAVSFVARCRGDTLSHLALNHPRAAGNEIFIVEHLEEDLGRDVVGIVAGKHKLFAAEDLVQIHA